MNRPDHDTPVTLVRRSFAAEHLRRLRRLVSWVAHRVGLDRGRGDDLALAVSEAASNAIKHGGTTGQLELIQDDARALIAQITDDGPGLPASTAPALPTAEGESGRGLFLMHQLCDRVEYRSGPYGTTVRLEMHLDSSPVEGGSPAAHRDSLS